MESSKPLCVVFEALALCLGASAVGVLATGRDLFPYLQFPVRDVYIAHAAPSWFVFVLYLIPIAAGAVFVVILNRGHSFGVASAKATAFPGWGWLGVALVSLGWTVAWTRFEIFALVQQHTFLMLWGGFIICANAILEMRVGSSPLGSLRRYYLALFPMSALFWWFYELINRTVQNWHYTGLEGFTAGGYVLFASLSFATVLPAVEAVYLVLSSLFPEPAFSRRIPLPILERRPAPWLLLALSLVGLAAVPSFSDNLFSLLWVGPLFALVALERLFAVPSFYNDWSAGRFRETCLWALAALVCGLFWEMWNYWSLAKWIYLIPFVGVLKVFEMPVLGYAGYLPFGVFCGAVVSAVRALFQEDDRSVL